MLFNVAGFSIKVPSDLPLSDLPLPTVEKVKKLDTSEKLNDFLKGRLNNVDKHIDKLTAQEVIGKTFLTLIQDDLLSINIPLGLAKQIIQLINNIQGVKGQPDAIQCSTDTTPLLYNLKSDTILSVVEVKPEQLMSDLINDEIELLNAYNTALIAEDDGSTVYIKHMKIIRIVRQLFGHTEDNTSFLEYMYYFEKLSTTNLVAHSSLSNTDGYDRENSRHLRFKASKFGVLHEAFIFILTLLARESFANVSNITKEKKQLAINSLLVIHARGVKHENGRRAGHGIS
ncbi:17180_t:CDS:2 [Funneliformis geosporum]|uniref:17180_t:CDS:1 n=1 Tax=Funneliformis geosporum TaxID=1117311 RepID=A0A9W4SJN7_9GLOM|nr:17180_t:CDS:2 [Funneliformis geosporum]